MASLGQNNFSSGLGLDLDEGRVGGRGWGLGVQSFV